jgi:hypothetical protein
MERYEIRVVCTYVVLGKNVYSSSEITYVDYFFE